MGQLTVLRQVYRLAGSLCIMGRSYTELAFHKMQLDAQGDLK